MTDLKERMRRYSYQQGTDDEQGQLIAELVKDLHDGADRIEELEDQIAVWKTTPIGRLEQVEADNEKLRDALEEVQTIAGEGRTLIWDRIWGICRQTLQETDDE